MRCSEFEHQLQTRGTQPDESAAYQRLSDHAAECGSCNARLQEEQLLSWSFAEIGAQLRETSPAPEIEHEVMKAFDLERQVRRRRPRNWPRYAAAAIAAALFLATVVSLAVSRRPPVPTAREQKLQIDLSTAVATLEIV